ncbi:hypothetical protein OS493_036199 [Desmophyllum pertusum]|uniref:Uncharacterized protein n=1 Tax=Desmophyllum pertusum TaxID=174260 RepID=A0A9W9YUU2_9CNID|nr:hypothetical protein OS493_036199 [Desmophyllum pertusum]
MAGEVAPAGEIARAVVEAGTKAALDLSLTFKDLSFSLKIENAWLAGAVSFGALSLGAYYLANKGPSWNATRRALERINNDGVDPKVRNITDGHSILVELHCLTETSFLLFLEDFEKKTVKLRLEEEFKKIGFKDELDVTIRNAEEVYEKARQIRERSGAPRESEKTEGSKSSKGKEASLGEKRTRVPSKVIQVSMEGPNKRTNAPGASATNIEPGPEQAKSTAKPTDGPALRTRRRSSTQDPHPKVATGVRADASAVYSRAGSQTNQIDCGTYRWACSKNTTTF